MPFDQHPAVPKIIPSLAGAAILAALFLAAVSWNRAQVFVPRSDGATLVVYADGDCHSRMQRAAMVADRPGTIVRAHDFENCPQGTVPHTTALMDYLIAALGLVVRPLDVAGAWVSPLLGLAALVFLFFWSRAIGLRPRWPMLILFAVSPALVHAFALGRPDHQSLLVALTTIALASNFAFVRTSRAAWAWTSGAAWGIAVWVSWFEPLVLLVAQEVARIVVLRKTAYPKTCQKALLLLGAIAIASWALEGFRNPWPSDEVRVLFPRWAALLGELQGATPEAMFTWTGWLLIPAPLLIGWSYYKSRDPLALIVLLLLVVVSALTGWQVRWSPWQAAIFCLALPWMLAPLGKTWVIWSVFSASLWPVAWVWDARISPPSARLEQQEKIDEARLLGEAARFLATQTRGGVLAPWWLSPALARLSGQPMVGGTSHQSLPGTADTARFFLSADEGAAESLLRKRMVRYVVSDDPDRVIPTSAQLLGVQPSRDALAVRLARGRDIPDFLAPVFANRFFRVYTVRDE
jgi:hypothetical protein